MSSNCLKITHFPDNLSNADKEDLLKHFGALRIKCVGQKKQTVFATFENGQCAATALKRLHQLQVLSCRLNVVFAKEKSDEWTQVPEPTSNNTNSANETDSHKCYEKFLQSLNAWNLPMELSQPPPSHLLYLYPPPSLEVVANISRALVAVPKFYTQVLHLMNKMNLPSPFHTTSPEFHTAISSLLGATTNLPPQEETAKDVEDVASGSSSESEMESEDEARAKIPSFIPTKRKAAERKVKRPKLIKLHKSKQGRLVVPVGDVFELGAKLLHKNITMNLNQKEEAPQKTIEEKKPAEEGFGILFPAIPPSSELQEHKEAEPEDESYISIHSLKANRIPEKDRECLPVFRNYQSGAPSCRLYIKNLSKSTTARELHFIFRAFLGHKPTDEQDNKMFDILHMTEGRMKGQAFVTFPTVAQAQRALQEANGYILNDKPMVVQFGRSKVQTPAAPS